MEIERQTKRTKKEFLALILFVTGCHVFIALPLPMQTTAIKSAYFVTDKSKPEAANLWLTMGFVVKA